MSFLQKNAYFKDAFYYSLLAFAFALPFRINFSNILLVILLITSFTTKDFFKNIVSGQRKVFLLFVIFFLLHILFLLNSKDLKSGFFVLEKQLAILIFPLITMGISTYLTAEKTEKILISFVLGTIAMLLYLFGIYIYHSTFTYYYYYPLEFFFREGAYKYVQLHPSYMGMYIAFAIFIIIINYKSKTLKEMILQFSSVGFLSFSILLTGARTPIIAFIIVLIFILLLSAKRYLHKIYIFLTLLIGIPVIILICFQVPVIYQRFYELTHTKLKPPVGIHYNSTNLRVAQFICSKDLLEENWLLGLGTGDVQNELNSCYKSKEWSVALFERSYNAHNQFIQTWLTLGVSGLILLLFIIVYLIWKASIKKDYLFLGFIILFSLCSLTESMFEKNKGVVFFSFFISILILKNQLLISEKKKMQVV